MTKGKRGFDYTLEQYRDSRTVLRTLKSDLSRAEVQLEGVQATIAELKRKIASRGKSHGGMQETVLDSLRREIRSDVAAIRTEASDA